MEFCNHCGKPLKIKGKIAICNCGFIKEISPVYPSEKINKPQERGKGVFEKKDKDKGFPHTCKKCGHEFADVVDLGASYSDEANVYLFKCKKCENVERDAYGTSNN